jgi:Mn-dependent DtxR family transcriptional regulator
MMAVVAGAQFFLAALVGPRHGWLVRLWRHLQLSLRIAGEEILATLYRAEEQQAAAYSLALTEHGLRPWVVRLAFWNMARLGLIDHGPDGFPILTVKGRRVAQSVVRSHRLWETYAGQVLALPPDHVHATASRMEHYIGPELQKELAETLQEPSLDPHGKAIPPSQPGETPSDAATK